MRWPWTATPPTTLDLHAKAATTLRAAESMGWQSIVREPYAGAWQQNVQVSVADILTYGPLYACVTLISRDIAKCRMKLVARDDDGIWTETDNPAFSPVLRRPNHYQNRIQFLESWIVSKIVHGNTYLLKQRDARNVVTALYPLDPLRVRVLVADNGDVFYGLQPDDLSSIAAPVTVPAREIIHDLCTPLYHPLVGVAPLTACGIAAVQGLRIQESSTLLFANGGIPGGILTAPQRINDEQAKRMQTDFQTNYSGANVGRIAVLGDGVKFQGLRLTAAETQLIDQLRWTAEQVCTALHVPPYMIGVGPPPNYSNIEALNVQYYTQCLQTYFECIELLLDEGLELPKPYGTELDIDDLLRMDTAANVEAAQKAIGSAALSINEARKKFFGLGPVAGGETPYLQQQYYALEALAQRPAPAPPAPAPMPDPAPPVPPNGEPPDEDELDDDDPAADADVERQLAALFTKELAWHATPA